MPNAERINGTQLDPVIVGILNEAQTRLLPLDFKLRVSRRGVPHLVSKDLVSVCYFKRTKRFRVFTNYGVSTASQEKFDAETIDGVIEIINELPAKQGWNIKDF